MLNFTSLGPILAEICGLVQTNASFSDAEQANIYFLGCATPPFAF